MAYVGISMIKKSFYIIFIIIFFSGCNKQTEKSENVRNQQTPIIEKILKQKKLRVAILNNSVSYFLYKGTPMGFHYELVKDYAEYLGVELSLHVATDYGKAFEMIASGECEILASSVNITGSRKKKMLFTTPLLRSNPVLVQNKQSSKQYIEDWLDVDSLQIAIVKESANERIINNISEDLGLSINASFYTGTDQEDLINLVANDSIPATIADKIIAKVAKTYYPQLDISIAAGLPHNMAWAVNLHGKELVENLNEWLVNYKKSRNYRQLYIKYFRNKKSILRNKEGIIFSSKRLSIYDKYIKQQAEILGWDWELLAALIYTESRFEASKVSWAGAFGLMQLMPQTARNFGASRNSSVENQIAAGRKYIQYLEEAFAKEMVDKKDLKQFVLAAYNSGLGHISDARKLTEKNGKDKDNWKDVATYILLLRNPKYYNDKVVKYGYFRGDETVKHVNRIMDLYKNYKGLFAQK